MEDDIKSEYVEIKILVTSFNMGAKTLDFESTKEQESVHQKISETVPPGYDVYVCGAQELVDETYFNIIDKTLSKRRFRRTATNTARVSGRGDGSFLNAKHTTIAIFISDNHKDKIKVRKCYSCSLGRMEGSKGAASLLLDISGTTIAFLCCHLSSNLPKDKQRNYRKMIQDVGALGDKHFSILSQVHHVVVFGDLNYRIRDISADEVLRKIEKEGSSRTLWDHDTLKNISKKNTTGMAFAGFREPRPRADFLPTYKKKPNRKVEIKKFKSGKLDVKDSSWLHDVYRTKYKEPMYKGGSLQDRIPSFTDRLLVYSMPTLSELNSKAALKFERDSKPYLFQIHRDPNNADNYGCIYGLTFSDHTPIYAGLRLFLPHLSVRPPYEFEGEIPMPYRLRLMNIQVIPDETKQVDIRSVRTLFPLHYENRNTKTSPSKKVDYSRLSAAEDDEKSEQLDRSPHKPKKRLLDSRQQHSGEDLLTLNEMLQFMAGNARQPDRPAIELEYYGPNIRDMEGGLHCLIKITLTDGKELEGGFAVPFENFELDTNLEKKSNIECVKFELFRKGRLRYGIAKLRALAYFAKK